MYPQSHFLFAFFISTILVKLGIFNYKLAFIISIFAVLIDIDHFIIFILKKHDYSLKDAWNAHVEKKYRGKAFLHHPLVFILITCLTIALFFINMEWFWIVGLSYYSHMFLDYSKLNILKIKEKVTIKEAHFIEKINKFEILFDISLFIGILLMVFF